MTFEIDGQRFSTLDGFYDEFTRVVIPDTDWGHNLDALDDLLCGGMGTPDGGFILVWRNSDKSRRDLGYAETVRQLEERLRTCHPLNRVIVAKEIEMARRAEGDTAFDWLVEIFTIHHDVTVNYE